MRLPAIGRRCPVKDRLLVWMAAVLLVLSVAACSAHAAEISAATTFSDVPVGESWTEGVAHVYAAGYMVGKSSESFDPAAPITHAEVAVLMLRAKYGADYVPASSGSEWWSGWVEAASEQGLLDPAVDPGAPATRADIATLIWLLEQ